MLLVFCCYSLAKFSLSTIYFWNSFFFTASNGDYKWCNLCCCAVLFLTSQLLVYSFCYLNFSVRICFFDSTTSSALLLNWKSSFVVDVLLLGLLLSSTSGAISTSFSLAVLCLAITRFDYYLYLCFRQVFFSSCYCQYCLCCC